MRPPPNWNPNAPLTDRLEDNSPITHYILSAWADPRPGPFGAGFFQNRTRVLAAIDKRILLAGRGSSGPLELAMFAVISRPRRQTCNGCRQGSQLMLFQGMRSTESLGRRTYKLMCIASTLTMASWIPIWFRLSRAFLESLGQSSFDFHGTKASNRRNRCQNRQLCNTRVARGCLHPQTRIRLNLGHSRGVFTPSINRIHRCILPRWSRVYIHAA